MRAIGLATVLIWHMFSAIPTLADSPVQDSATAGCSGGVTGGGSGGIVRADGTILRWSKATIRDVVTEEIVRSDLREAKGIFDQLEKLGFTTIHYSTHGNMTCFLRVQLEGSSHDVSWEAGDSKAPPSVVELALRILDLAWPGDSAFLEERRPVFGGE
jgi:hypothetical protein